MQDAMFSGLFGALTTEHRMAVIANNLANVNTHGYKADKLSFKDTMAFYAHDEIREPLANCRSKPLFPEPKNMARARIGVSKTDYSQGALHLTGDPLDVAIGGENAFFRVQTPTGEYLTREGHFVVNADGLLMTAQGYTVSGVGGDIIIPPGTRNVVIGPTGQVTADNDLVGQIALVSVDNPKNLQKRGYNLYMPKDNINVDEADAYANGARLEQGFMEVSNVEVVSEMVQMIEVQRQFEAYQKVMQTADAIDRAANDKVGKRQG